jgi:PKD repeat protein
MPECTGVSRVGRKIFRIKSYEKSYSRFSDTCLEPHAEGDDNAVRALTCDVHRTRMLWNLELANADYPGTSYKIVSRDQDTCLTALSSDNDIAHIGCHGELAQQWQIIGISSIGAQIVSRYNGQCLTEEHNKSNIRLAACPNLDVIGNMSGQLWHFVERRHFPRPFANFSAKPTTGVAPLTVSFTDESGNASTSWAWTFGDGSSSRSQNPTHVYTQPGSYTVSLTVTSSSGSDTETKSNLITVSLPTLKADFHITFPSTINNAPLTVMFTDQSKGNPTAWFWNFGDGSTSPFRNPTHIYTAGPWTYRVSLTVTRADGSDTHSESIAVLPPQVQVYGSSQLKLFNCDVDHRTLHIWLYDDHNQGPSDLGWLDAQYEGGLCRRLREAGFLPLPRLRTGRESFPSSSSSISKAL